MNGKQDLQRAYETGYISEEEKSLIEESDREYVINGILSVIASVARS